MEHEIDQFDCLGEGGEQYRVLVYRDVRGARTMRNPYGQVQGLKTYRLEGGGHVNFIDQDTFKVVRTGEIIRRV